ncbi:MAG: 1-acyl-sn-glycerol-3-phosphate acyltransferase [Actinobacteria bacterium]|nr:1-acyl-sn-glycerol-3-phosphate acyltransferase [Actinomycetota bacterium]MCL5446316.1 1-acyl-sn-glycerol-3-phosphate acyltransferase [Actinomycetota bacterium]
MSREFPFAKPVWPVQVPAPLPARSAGIYYDTSWSRSKLANCTRSAFVDNVLRPAIHLIARPSIEGVEALNLLEPPAIFVANHSSHLDTPLMLSVLPKRFREKVAVAAAADYFFDRTWKAHLFSLALAAIPVERKRPDRTSARLAVSLIEDGWNLVIFPEGGRSPDGWMQEIRGGAAYMAEHTGRPLVPVHVDGTYAIMPKGGTKLRPGSTRVTFGRPISHTAGENAHRIGKQIYDEFARLADESSSDWWTATKRAAAGTSPSPRGPEAAAWLRAWNLPSGSGDGASSRLARRRSSFEP